MSKTTFLDSLIGLSICHAIKSPDLDLYDFGFSAHRECQKHCIGSQSEDVYILHATCRFQITWRIGCIRTNTYYEDTPSEIFDLTAKKLIGLTVKGLALSEKNDLWLDLGYCHIVFATFETDEESWRLFVKNSSSPHFIASNSWTDFS